MSLCRKCNTTNEEGLTRCKSCKAILPVKLGSESEVRYERIRRQPDLVGVKCPKCETMNPYTLFRCKKCNSLLGAKKQTGPNYAKLAIIAAGALIVLGAVAAVLLKMM